MSARLSLSITREDDDGLEITTEVPAHYEVCGRCKGRGTHDHPAFSNGITSSEMEEAGDDFRAEYMAGRYDVQCEECKGERVVLEPNAEEELTAEQREAVAYRENRARQVAQWDAEDRATRRMESGGCW